jgi:glycosyltransferase involved in cell wall biosynthesis
MNINMIDKNHQNSKLPLVVHIITKLELGGAQRVTLDTLRSLNGAKFRKGLIAGSDGELTGEALKLENCTVHLIPHLVHPIRLSKDFQALFVIYKHLRKLRPSVVHTHSSKAGLIGRWAAFFAGVPVRIHSVHGWSFNDYQHPLKRTLFLILEKISSPITTYFFLESRKHIRIGLSRNLIKENRYALLNPGIDFSEFDRIRKNRKKAATAKPLDELIRQNKKIITMVACFKPQKAPLDFIKAASIVNKEIKNACFVLAGDGILRQQIESEIKKLGLLNDVILLGWRKDIAAIIASSDLLVLTSLWEGMPTVIPMAMRLGVPVTTSRIDGCAELVEHGVNGLLSDPGEPASIADNIIQILKDSVMRKKISENSFKYTYEFEIGRTTVLQENVYINLLSRGKINGN